MRKTGRWLLENSAHLCSASCTRRTPRCAHDFSNANDALSMASWAMGCSRLPFLPPVRPIVRWQQDGSGSLLLRIRHPVLDTPIVFLPLLPYTTHDAKYGRYEVGRFFGAVERLKRAAEEQNNREAQTAFAAMSVAYDRYLKVSTTKLLPDRGSLAFHFSTLRRSRYYRDATSSQRKGEPSHTTKVPKITSTSFIYRTLFASGPSLVKRVVCPVRRDVCHAK